MKVIHDNLWLCTDCLMIAVNGDASSLDYHHGDKADEREVEINEGLERLGPNLVTFFNTEEDNGFWCRSCDTYLYTSDLVQVIDPHGCDGDTEDACPHCKSSELSEIGNGHEEFSNKGCDCCGSMLAGELHRFAIIEHGQLLLPFMEAA